MNAMPNKSNSPSYFWDCVTLSDNCPFFSTTDPKLYYFGVCLMTIYAAFFLTILADLSLDWTLDDIQQKIDFCVNFVKTKLHQVQADQRRLMSTQDRTEKQIRRSRECTNIVTALRGALSTDDPYQAQALTGNFDNYNIESID